MTSIDQLYKSIEKGREGKNMGLSTGLPKMDWYTGGLLQGIYTLVFGVSGSGKSSYVLYSDIYRPLKDYPEKDIIYIYFSLEMSSEVLLAKLLGLYIYEEFGLVIPYMDLLSWREILSDELYEYVLKGRAWLESISKKLIIYDKSLSAESFYATMMNLLQSWGEFKESSDGRRIIYEPKNPERIVCAIIDHMGLLKSIKHREKKDEIDQLSSYCVTLREKCKVSFFVVMQENRNAGSMDRRKADLSESTADDVKDSGNPYNDCNVCIAIYSPSKYKLNTYRGYRVLGEDGLQDRIRGAILLKNRFGQCEKAFCLNFHGEVGLFKELPKPEEIRDITEFQTILGIPKRMPDTTVSDTVAKDSSKKLIYSF